MFNLKRKFQKLNQSIKIASMSVESVIADIHNEFDTAGDKLLQEAKRILSQDSDLTKGKRLQALGFKSAEQAVMASELERNKAKQKQLATHIEYYQIHYPNNKFITQEVAREICAKYGLVLAGIEYYKADVPEKNISEIENFKLRNADRDEHKCGYFTYTGGYLRESVEKTDLYGWNEYRAGSGGIAFHGAKEGVEYEYTKKPMEICASEKDFDMTYLRKEGHTLVNIPDPIVLQPVNGGYLIVSKWGLEASDELVINEKQN